MEIGRHERHARPERTGRPGRARPDQSGRPSMRASICTVIPFFFIMS
jgi:hypothetical protein